MDPAKSEDNFRNTKLRTTHRSTRRRGVFLGGLFRGLVLMVWLLGVPGLRPVYHHHRDDGPGGGSAAEQVRLSEHLRQYIHRDSADTAKLHFHWVVQLDGPGSAAFPNAPPMQDISHATRFSEPFGLSASEKLLLDFALQATFVWLGLPCPDVEPEGLKRNARSAGSRVSEQARRFAYCSTLYRTARL
ncbi:MAG: hypothetical protein LW720_07045 [Pirellula sp.]|nr:hypothetical protein [Pirellula sp.]